MYYLPGGGMRQGIDYLKRVAYSFVQGQRAFLLDQFAYIFPLDKFEDYEMNSAVFADIIHSGDVFVIESSSRLGFVLKTLNGFRIGGLFGRKNFNRHGSGQSRVDGSKYSAHTPAAYIFDQFEMLQDGRRA